MNLCKSEGPVVSTWKGYQGPWRSLSCSLPSSVQRTANQTLEQMRRRQDHQQRSHRQRREEILFTTQQNLANVTQPFLNQSITQEPPATTVCRQEPVPTKSHESKSKERQHKNVTSKAAAENTSHQCNPGSPARTPPAKKYTSTSLSNFYLKRPSDRFVLTTLKILHWIAAIGTLGFLPLIELIAIGLYNFHQRRKYRAISAQ